MTYLIWHLGDLWETLTSSPWPARVFVIILAVFLTLGLISWWAGRRGGTKPN